MKNILLTILGALAVGTVLAAKPPVQFAMRDKWTSVSGGVISSDGRYAAYVVNNSPADQSTVVILSTASEWKKELVGARDPVLTSDSAYLIYKASDNSVGIQRLGSELPVVLTNIKTYRLPKSADKGWLAYQLQSPEGELVLREIASGREHRFKDVSDYFWSDNGTALVLQTASGVAGQSADNSATLHWVDLKTGKRQAIWQGAKVGKNAFDSDAKRWAFIAEKTPGQRGLWLFKKGEAAPVQLVNDANLHEADGALLGDSPPEFYRNGQSISFSLVSSDKRKAPADAVMVNVWSYTDAKLQSEQVQRMNGNTYFYTAVFNLASGKMVRLTQRDETIWASHMSAGARADHVLIMREPGAKSEVNWNKAAQRSAFLVDVRDGSRILIDDDVYPNSEFPWISPEGRWVVRYDHQKRNFFSYEIATGKTRNLTQGIPVSWLPEDSDVPEPQGTLGVGWLKDDAAVLLNDNYDIWRVDPTGRRAPFNVTNGFGRKHNIEFKWYLYKKPMVPAIDITLNAFSLATKDYGLYTVDWERQQDPKLLTMGPYVGGYFNHYEPIKAANASMYLMQRASATQASNYFLTQDLKTFRPISDVQPQKAYNWLTTELVSWKTFDGSPSQGILYKPEDFDPHKKYPLILYFYEKLSEDLNKFVWPAPSDGPMNIPWFVSRGYLVFVPDIHYKVGTPGESAYNAIVSAAEHLRTMPWVDGAKMGIQGHSFGGYEVNYVLTKTNIFAAAMSAAGPSNYISGYGMTSHSGQSRHWLYERNQSRIGATLWERPDLYIQNSPVFNADKVTTPLLMMHNERDRQVPWAEGLQWFIGLRRLGKPVWMLQYENGGHGVDGKDADDLTLRMQQFFDFYLKDALPPKWLTQGVPNVLKGIDTGLELDGSGKKPGAGLARRR